MDELAAALRKTTRTLRNWRSDGMPTRLVSGQPRFDLADVLAWREDRIRDEAARSAAAPEAGHDKDAEMARKLAAEASIAELKLEQLRADVVPVQQYRDELERVVGGFAAVAMGRLQRFERDIVAATTPAAARKLVERIQDALMEGAQEFADELEAIEEGADPEQERAA